MSCVMLCDGVFDAVNGGEGSCKVKGLILSCWGVLVMDRRMDGQTN